MNILRKLRKFLTDPKSIVPFFQSKISISLKFVAKNYNLHIMSMVCKRANRLSEVCELNEIEGRSRLNSDIGDHLITLFVESLISNPKLIVELGIRGGESTFVFERVAKLCHAQLVSVDIVDCSSVSSYKEWKCIKDDDIRFASYFVNWCKDRHIKPEIDLLLVDTSHIFEHTVAEIDSWFPFLSKKAKVFFHDTNMGKMYFTKKGYFNFGWDSNRGVIRALENYFNTTFNEKEDFVDIKNGWLIKHHAYCNGLTILEKIDF